MNKPINHLTRDDVAAFESHLDDCTHWGGDEANTIDYYMELVSKSAIYPGQGTPFGLMYVGLGLAEGGEVQNKIKKAFRDDGIISMTHEGENAYSVEFFEVPVERKEQIIKELGGLAWYFVVLCKELDIKPSDVLLQNMIELASRTERGTLAGDGDNR